MRIDDGQAGADRRFELDPSSGPGARATAIARSSPTGPRGASCWRAPRRSRASIASCRRWPVSSAVTSTTAGRDTAWLAMWVSASSAVARVHACEATSFPASLARASFASRGRDRPLRRRCTRIDRARHDADRRMGVGRDDLIRRARGRRGRSRAGRRRCRLPARHAAADLRKLERRVDAARRFRRIGRSTTTEMFRSDDACAMATTLMPPVSSAVKTRAEMPRVPAMPSPTTATTDSEVLADTSIRR